MAAIESLFVTVQKQTAESIHQLQEQIGLTPGELIDRLLLKREAKTAEAAALLICEEIAIVTGKLDTEEKEKAIEKVLAVFNAN